jgi:hypothetical protein
MKSPHRTSLLLTSAVCGTLALALTTATTGTTTATPVPEAPPVRAQAPAPDALRKAAVDGARAIASNPYTQAARHIARACDAPQAAGPAQPAKTCASAKSHLGELSTAHNTLRQQSRAAAPNLDAITTATTDAVAATAHLAKDGIKPELRAPDAVKGDAGRGGHHRRDGASGLLSVVTGLVSGLVSSLSGIVSGLSGLVTGLLQGLLDA